MVRQILALVCAVAIGMSVQAATRTWIGDVDSDWSDPNNWDGNTLPADDDDIIIDADDYTNAPVMNGNSPFTIDDLFVRDGATFTITSGSLTINDDIFVDNATFTMNGGSLNVDEITGDNSAAVNLLGGTVTMTNDLDANSNSVFTIATTVTQTSGGEDLNIGDGAQFIIQDGANVTGFDDIDFDGSSTGGTYTQTGGTMSVLDDIKMQDGPNNTMNVSGGVLTSGDDFEIETDNNNITFSGDADVNIGGHFELGASGGGSSDDATNTTITVTDNANLDITGDLNFYEGGSGNSTVMNILGSGYVSTNNTDDLNSVNISEGGQLNNGGTVLPVDLVHFSGVFDGIYVVLNWATASELNNDYFEVLRSNDGSAFEVIGRVDGHGNSTELIKYEFKDTYPGPRGNYYRLQQFDYDGQSELFEVIRAENEEPESENLNIVVFPNPAAERFQIQGLNMSSLAHVRIFDMNGTLVYADRWRGNGQPFVVAPLPNGTYYLRVITDRSTVTSRIVIKH